MEFFFSVQSIHFFFGSTDSFHLDWINTESTGDKYTWWQFHRLAALFTKVRSRPECEKLDVYL